MQPRPDTLETLKALVGFDTVSRASNLELIDYVADRLDGLGVESVRIHDSERAKANLYATIGPRERRGIALSGHTDVVPVDGQDWATDPFTAVERDGRVYGRGTADMKAFIAVALALLPELATRPLATPIHLALSYDEEIGCLGVRGLLDWLGRQPVRPRGVIVGEPTGMQVVRAHKGKLSCRARVRGLESHSGLAHRGVNAVEAAAEAIAFLKARARRFRDEGPYDAALSPPYTTVHTGVVRGGTQLNIVPAACSFDFEVRHLPEDDPEAVLDELRSYLEASVLPEMRAVHAAAGFDWEPLARIPGLDAGEDSAIVQLALALTGRNATAKVSFGTEAGLFAAHDMPAVVCGPGHIEQAHKPDEYVSLAQLAQCERFVAGLFERCAA